VVEGQARDKTKESADQLMRSVTLVTDQKLSWQMHVAKARRGDSG
jgi:hypothetical protein